MSEKPVILTKEGLDKLEKELDFLRTVRRREVAKRIKEALGHGDISENSEYDDAKNEQAFVEGKIAELEKKLRNAQLIDDSDIKTDVVTFGARVRLKDLEEGDEMEYTVVGSAEADPMNQKISNESPVGHAIMGQGVGSVVEVQVPAGTLKFQITGISR